MTYVTASIVFTEENIEQADKIISFAHELGVADIRFVTASHGEQLVLKTQNIPSDLLDKNPILSYRTKNLHVGRQVRGLQPSDAHKCHLVLDDSVVSGKWHYPCGVYFREGGMPIGEVGPAMREQRAEWFKSTDTHAETICAQFCSDFYIEYNNRCEEFLRAKKKQLCCE
ncbi:MAG: hypothetical protein QM730_03090 [Anaerolineales bacterium]